MIGIGIRINGHTDEVPAFYSQAAVEEKVL
jgi:hypothetical protein